MVVATAARRTVVATTLVGRVAAISCATPLTTGRTCVGARHNEHL
ncbi:hypothetical protein [Nonomuraea phyllanthi]|nr:hypothetical protein [Nonomuraea phyllanthi]